MTISDWKVNDQVVYECQVGEHIEFHWEQREREPIKIQAPAKARGFQIDYIHCEPKSWLSIFPFVNGKWMCHAIVRKT